MLRESEASPQSKDPYPHHKTLNEFPPDPRLHPER